MSVMKLERHSTRLHGHRVGKLGSSLETGIFNKLERAGQQLASLITEFSDQQMYYQEACRYWVKASNGYPFFRRNGEKMSPPHGRTVSFQDRRSCAFAVCLISSSLFYWFYSCFSDCEHINDALVRGFFIPGSQSSEDWLSIEGRLSARVRKNSVRKVIMTKQGHKIEYDELDASHSKSILDEIDIVLARDYGLTEEEIDFIVNYDIKYRMGIDAGPESSVERE